MITLELLHNMVTEELQNLFFNHLKNLCKPLGGAEGEGSVLNSAHLAPGQPSDATIRADGADAVCQVSSTGGRLEMKTHRGVRTDFSRDICSRRDGNRIFSRQHG